MRIIAGSARGRQIAAPKGLATRPTLDRVRESLFGILQFSLEGARVLDLYAGSGSLGLEALSRGAAYAVFNDRDRACGDIVRKNLETLGFSERALVLELDALAAIGRLAGQAFDLVFLDPPYRDGAQRALAALFSQGLVAPGGRVVVEHAWQEPPEETPGLFARLDSRKYGDTGLSFFSAPAGKDKQA